MVDVVASLSQIEMELLELQRLAREMKYAAAEEERQLGEQLRVIRGAKEESQSVSKRVGVSGGNGRSGRSSPREIIDPSDEHFGYLLPAEDPETEDPIYDLRVVSGYKTNRERANAAAMVYGRSLREKSLAEAVYATGETEAADAPAARSSLGSLVRYGTDWKRSEGWLYFQGDLSCNAEMVRLLSGEGVEITETSEGKERADESGLCGQC